MSDERKREFGKKDFDGGDIVNEVRESNSEENDGETVSVSSLNSKGIKARSIDRLSALPDSLLIHILSLIDYDMKKAVITSVLSKRWQYLWTELPKLRFKEYSTDIEKTRKLVTRVHRALVLRTSNYLDEFRISIAYDKCFASDVNVWVEFGVKSKVKHLHLELHSCRDDFYMLPQALYSCSSLTWLSVQGCTVAPQKTVDWRFLTELHIEDVELHENAIRKVLSGCPVLRDLHLTSCWGFECLEIDTPSLHHLTVEDCENENTGALLQISAPYICYLHISPLLIERKNVRITNVPSLTCAEIHFELTGFKLSEEEMIDTMKFFEDIKHVKELILGCQCLEILAKLAENGWQLPQSTRNSLIVEAYRNEDSISGIVALLESSPNLESLAIQCDDPFVDECGYIWGPVVRDNLACNLVHLKTVNLTNYASPHLSGEPMLTMARILLKRATSLKKMTVDAYGSLTEYSSFFTEIAQELLSFPRSSKKAVILLDQ